MAKYVLVFLRNNDLIWYDNDKPGYYWLNPDGDISTVKIVPEIHQVIRSVIIDIDVIPLVKQILTKYAGRLDNHIDDVVADINDSKSIIKDISDQLTRKIGNIELLRYAKESIDKILSADKSRINITINSCDDTTTSCDECKKSRTPYTDAILRGHVKCLETIIYENGCPSDEHLCSSAVMANQLDCLKCLHENGCPWSKWTCRNAAVNKRLSCLQYLYDNGCPWDESVVLVSGNSGILDCYIDKF